MKQAFGYIRVSGNGQFDRSGPERQAQRITAYAEQNGIHLAATYEEQVSGTKDETGRPIFLDMIQDAKRQGITLILMEDLSRLARSTRAQDQILVFLAAQDLGLVTVDTGIDAVEAIRDDEMMEAFISMQGVFNQLERKRIVRRLKRGKEITGRKGGRPTFYTQALKQRIRELRKHKASYNSIAALFHEEGVPTSGKHHWSPQLVRQVAIKG